MILFIKMIYKKTIEIISMFIDGEQNHLIHIKGVVELVSILLLATMKIFINLI